ncbi:hypothetical protein GGR56DRAFT_617015 [Xylariaceae sp. FL0804]|nr:hypothetical protein GGR56DRAFT_617015 [Xylariaceae sp. FL0804]
MRACRGVYGEVANALYGGARGFDFSAATEAVEPFLMDLTPATRRMIRGVALYKHGPPLLYNDGAAWSRACEALAAHAAVRELRLVVQGGRPYTMAPTDTDTDTETDTATATSPGGGGGELSLSAADIALLARLRHESLEWAADLARLRRAGSLERFAVAADVRGCAPPRSSAARVFVALSGSIENGLAEFLRGTLGLA